MTKNNFIALKSAEKRNESISFTVSRILMKHTFAVQEYTTACTVILADLRDY